MNNLKNDLSWRNLLKEIANEENFDKLVSEKASFYIGIDPTSDSMHVGHYMTIALSKVLNNHGLKPVFVIGGFTGSIGDPSGKNSEREVVDTEEIKNNSDALRKQLSEIADKAEIKDYKIINNLDFYSQMSIVELFQKYGKHFNVNTMLGREMVKNRLETGISFTEFAYQMFQAIDFLELYKEHGVSIQIGGSDQWGNIASGLELIRKVEGHDSVISGMTVNLITDENGNKIGKTNGRPIWLDSKKTSSYEMFQYFINLTDETSKNLLSALTNITEEEFNAKTKDHEANPRARVMQNELAKRMMAIIHPGDYDECVEASKILFEERYFDLNENQINSLLGGIPSLEKEGETISDYIINSGSLKSKRELREFIDSGAIKLNGNPITEEQSITEQDFIKGKVAFINVGKKNKYIIWK